MPVGEVPGVLALQLECVPEQRVRAEDTERASGRPDESTWILVERCLREADRQRATLQVVRRQIADRLARAAHDRSPDPVVMADDLGRIDLVARLRELDAIGVVAVEANRRRR